MRYLSVRNTPNSMTDLVHKIIIPVIFCPMKTFAACYYTDVLSISDRKNKKP